MIHWNVEPEVIPSLTWLPLRWYSLGFLISFILGYRWFSKRLKESGKPVELMDSLLNHMILGTILGARLGHCLFYEPDVYLADPIRILKVWEGGLASHGAAIGILLALYLFVRKHGSVTYLWLVDRIVVGVAFAGGMIRLGNLMNSEIIGKPTDVPWAFVFEKVDMIPRHPTQLYEAATYFLSWGILLYCFFKLSWGKFRGKLLGLFLILIFGTRVFWEFFKEHQVAFEEQLPLGLGQLLSIPFILLGLWLVSRPQQQTSL